MKFKKGDLIRMKRPDIYWSWVNDFGSGPWRVLGRSGQRGNLVVIQLRGRKVTSALDDDYFELSEFEFAAQEILDDGD